MKAVLTSLAAALIGAALFAGGYLLHSFPARTTTHIVTVTKTAPPKVITQWKTRTVMESAATPAPSTPCSMVNSGFLVVGSPGGNSTPDGTCQVALYGTDGNGSVKLSDDAGRITWYDLGVPAATGSG